MRTPSLALLYEATHRYRRDFCTLSFCCEASILARRAEIRSTLRNAGFVFYETTRTAFLICATCRRFCGLAVSPRAVTCVACAGLGISRRLLPLAFSPPLSRWLHTHFCATCQRSCGLAASPRAVTRALRGLRYFPPALASHLPYSCRALLRFVAYRRASLPYLRDVPAFLRAGCLPSRNNLRRLRGSGI